MNNLDSAVFYISLAAFFCFFLFFNPSWDENQRSKLNYSTYTHTHRSTKAVEGKYTGNEAVGCISNAELVIIHSRDLEI